jgi:hypothetical protein
MMRQCQRCGNTLAAQGACNCPACGARVGVPYGYAPYAAWRRAPKGVAPVVVAPMPASVRNVPALVSFYSGLFAFVTALFFVGDRGDKSTVCLSLLGIATAVIGLHLSGSAMKGRGRFLAGMGLAFSVIALFAAPLPAPPTPGPKLRRLDTCPRSAPHVAAPRQIEEAQRQLPREEKRTQSRPAQAAPARIEPARQAQKPPPPESDSEEEGF